MNADDLAKGAFFDQKPDSDDPRFDILIIRLPHGGSPRPVTRYEGRLAGYRLLRFCAGYVKVAETHGKHALVNKLARFAKTVSKEEAAWVRKNPGVS